MDYSARHRLLRLPSASGGLLVSPLLWYEAPTVAEPSRGYTTLNKGTKNTLSGIFSSL